MTGVNHIRYIINESKSQVSLVTISQRMEQSVTEREIKQQDGGNIEYLEKICICMEKENLDDEQKMMIEVLKDMLTWIRSAEENGGDQSEDEYDDAELYDDVFRKRSLVLLYSDLKTSYDKLMASLRKRETAYWWMCRFGFDGVLHKFSPYVEYPSSAYQAYRIEEDVKEEAMNYVYIQDQIVKRDVRFSENDRKEWNRNVYLLMLQTSKESVMKRNELKKQIQKELIEKHGNMAIDIFRQISKDVKDSPKSSAYGVEYIF